MRKNLKRKKRSCGLCKPNKVGWSSRWKAKEKQDRKIWEKEEKLYAFQKENQV